VGVENVRKIPMLRLRLLLLNVSPYNGRSQPNAILLKAE